MYFLEIPFISVLIRKAMLGVQLLSSQTFQTSLAADDMKS